MALTGVDVTSRAVVLFDFDGTLCNTEVENIRLVQGVLHQMGADVSLEELEVLTGGPHRP